MSLSSGNPFATPSTLEYQLPDFANIRDEHYLPAFYTGCAEQLAEVDAIVERGEASFEAVVVALELSGAQLQRVLNVFFNKSSADTSKVIDEIEAELAPKLAAHQDAIRLNPRLFALIEQVHSRLAQLDLSPQDAWLVERYHRDFVHAGARLTGLQREELMALNQRLSELETKFGSNLLADQNELAVLVTEVEELAGLSEGELAAAAAAAASKGLTGWLIDLVNYTGHPLLSSLEHRELRHRLMHNSLIKGGRDGEFDNRPVLLEMVRLRAKRARLLGFANHAAYVLSEQTAGQAANVHKMLRQIAPAAVANARAEAAEIQAIIDADCAAAGTTRFAVQSHDWDLFTERVRKAKYDIDTALFKPYFELESVLFKGVFWAAEQLYGVRFVERGDLLAYHPEARVFEVFNADSTPIGLFIGDFFTRDSKRGGAWMNNLVDQSELLGQLPVVVNNLNVPKPAPGEPALLTFDETTTLFHEFGHALHGLFSAVRYPRFSGTWVHRDFVEFPSQVNEMWMLWPEVLANYARHYQTGEPLPADWVANLQRAETFNQGQATTSYLAASVLDLAWHELDEAAANAVDSVEDFEANAIAAYGLDFAPTPTRYRSSYFSHIFAGGYSAGYYGYIWSEVLDADTVDWFKQNGGLLRANGDRFRSMLLSRGGSLDSMQMYREFRGGDAPIEPLLKRRGLTG